MKGKKFIVAIVVMAAMVLSTVSANGKKEGNAPEEDKTIRIFGAFRGEEAARFDQIVQIFNAQTGYNVVYEGSPEFETQILLQAEAGTPPDIAALPQPGLMKNFASKGFIKPLSSDVVSKIDANYAKVWKDLGSSNGKVYGVFHRVNAKSFVWYPKKAFEAKGYKVPATWDELIQLQNMIIADGGIPWSIGFESGGATGWVGTDWLEDIMLRTAGPDAYDKWVTNELAFNSPEVLRAIEYMGDIMLDETKVYGGPINILTTNFGDAVKPLYVNPPQAYLHRQGNFITGFMQEEIQANLEAEVGVFALPSIDSKWGTPVLGGGDQFVVFTDKPGVSEFMQFLTTWESCAPWASVGGALFPHKKQNFDDYGSSIEREMAKALVNATVFRFDASDLMPAEVGAGTFWTGMVDYVGGRDAKEVLTNINKSWPK